MSTLKLNEKKGKSETVLGPELEVIKVQYFLASSFLIKMIKIPL